MGFANLANQSARDEQSKGRLALQTFPHEPTCQNVQYQATTKNRHLEYERRAAQKQKRLPMEQPFYVVIF